MDLGNCKIDALRYKLEFDKMMKEMKCILSDTKYFDKYAAFEKEYEHAAEREQICVVVAGEWSTGKSSLIYALTGDESIKRGSNVTTHEVHQYQYEGFQLIDTPGLLSGNEQDTQVAKREIQNADMVLYCITSELFTKQSKKEFVDIVKSDRYNKVILVVNKIDREDTGEDFIEMLRKYREEIIESLENAEIYEEQYDLAFVSVKFYLDARNSNDGKLIDRSCFNDLLALVNDTGEIEPYLMKKCERQAEMLCRFAKGINEEMTAMNPAEDELSKEKEELRQKINKTFSIVSNRIQHICLVKVEEVFRTINDGFSENAPLDEILDKVNEALTVQSQKAWQEAWQETENLYDEFCQKVESYQFMQQSSQQETNDQILVENDSPKKKGWFASLVQSISKKGSNAVNGGLTEGITKTAEKINTMASPVPTGKEGLFFKKVVMSEAGGKGTVLYDVVSKVPFPFSEKFSISIATIANLATQHKIKIVAAASVFGVAKEIKEEMDENRRYEDMRNQKRTVKKEVQKKFKNLQKEFLEQTRAAQSELLEKLYFSIDSRAISKEQLDMKKLQDRVNSIYVEIKGGQQR